MLSRGCAENRGHECLAIRNRLRSPQPGLRLSPGSPCRHPREGACCLLSQQLHGRASHPGSRLRRVPVTNRPPGPPPVISKDGGIRLALSCDILADIRAKIPLARFVLASCSLRARTSRRSCVLPALASGSTYPRGRAGVSSRDAFRAGKSSAVPVFPAWRFYRQGTVEAKASKFSRAVQDSVNGLEARQSRRVELGRGQRRDAGLICDHRRSKSAFLSSRWPRSPSRGCSFSSCAATRCGAS